MTISPLCCLSLALTVIVPLITLARAEHWTLQTVQTTPRSSQDPGLHVAPSRLRDKRGKVKCFISYDISFCHGLQISTSTLPGELKLGAQIHDSHVIKTRFVEILEIDYETYCLFKFDLEYLCILTEPV